MLAEIQKLRGRGEYEAALGAVRAAMADAPGDGRLRVQLIQLLRAAGHEDAARAEVETIDPVAEGHAGLLAEKAAWLREDGAHDAAGALLDRVEQLAPGNPRLALERMRLALAMDDRTAAEAAAARAVAAHPGSEAVLLEALPLAADRAQRRTWAEALAALPGASMAGMIQAGDDLVRLEAFEAAGAAADALVARFGERPPAALAGANLLWRLGRVEDAAAALDRVRGRLPDSVDAALTQANVEAGLGRRDAAVAQLRAGLERKPGNPALSARLGEMLLEAGRTDEAAAFLTAWVPPEGPFAERRRASLLEIALAQGDVAGALRLAEESAFAATSPATPLAATRRVWLRLMNGRLDDIRGVIAESQGAQPKLTRSFAGQVANDYLLEPDLARDCAGLLTGGGDVAAAAGRLAALAAGHPGSLVPAVAAGAALRASGAVREGPEAVAGGEAEIPGIVHVYFPDDTGPEDRAAQLAAIAEAHPGLELREHDDRTARAALEAYGLAEAAKRIRRVPYSRQRRDVFRLGCLWAEGGVFVTPEYLPGVPAWALAPKGCRLFALHEPLYSVSRDLLAAAPKHPLIGWALEDAIEGLAFGVAMDAWLSTGPGVLTRALAATGIDPGTGALREGTVLVTARPVLPPPRRAARPVPPAPEPEPEPETRVVRI